MALLVAGLCFGGGCGITLLERHLTLRRATAAWLLGVASASCLIEWVFQGCPLRWPV